MCVYLSIEICTRRFYTCNIECGGWGGIKIRLGFWMCVYLSNTGTTVDGQGVLEDQTGQLRHVSKSYTSEYLTNLIAE